MESNLLRKPFKIEHDLCEDIKPPPGVKPLGVPNQFIFDRSAYLNSRTVKAFLLHSTTPTQAACDFMAALREAGEGKAQYALLSKPDHHANYFLFCKRIHDRITVCAMQWEFLLRKDIDLKEILLNIPDGHDTSPVLASLLDHYTQMYNFQTITLEHDFGFPALLLRKSEEFSEELLNNADNLCIRKEYSDYMDDIDLYRFTLDTIENGGCFAKDYRIKLKKIDTKSMPYITYYDCGTEVSIAGDMSAKVLECREIKDYSLLSSPSRIKRIKSKQPSKYEKESEPGKKRSAIVSIDTLREKDQLRTLLPITPEISERKFAERESEIANRDHSLHTLLDALTI